MDGTILDTLGDLANAVNYSLKEFGLPQVSRDTVRLSVGDGTRILIRRVVGDVSPETFESLLDYEKSYYAAHSDVLTKPYEGIARVLAELRSRGVKTAVVSNKFQAAVSELAEKYFPGLFDVSIGENEEAGIRKKPAPDMVFAALERLGAAADAAVYIGDSEVDWLTAENTGLPLILADWGFRTYEETLDRLGPEKSRDLEAELDKQGGRAVLVHRPEDIAKIFDI